MTGPFLGNHNRLKSRGDLPLFPMYDITASHVCWNRAGLMMTDRGPPHKRLFSICRLAVEVVQSDFFLFIFFPKGVPNPWKQAHLLTVPVKITRWPKCSWGLGTPSGGQQGTGTLDTFVGKICKRGSIDPVFDGWSHCIAVGSLMGHGCERDHD